ncbi:hypothetical protein CPAR01_11436 [Colletotrichum paranaense]|uniref:Uncharacterized protein n=1 Tax=Colletotrichum paranaense TaxID=1914294 RepID=A0ABQ9SBM7_9PEZI|nr:uncharacterized protein CPAR01_11436 [Colletotrichum paranaense]KAK1531787.1 hypothetical protein CPAR01_11436 [Colletotrichum paranaense]
MVFVRKLPPKSAKNVSLGPGLWTYVLAERLRSGEYLQPFTSVTSTSGWNQALILDKGDDLELHQGLWAILENTEMSRSRGVGVHLAFLAPPVGADEPAQGKKAEIAAPEVGRLLGLREPFEGRTRVRLQPERRTT